MKRLYILRGMRRSGNHALVNWLLAQDRFEFSNSIVRFPDYVSQPQESLRIPSGREWFHARLREGRKQAILKKRWGDWLAACPFFAAPPLVSLEDVDVDFQPFVKADYPVVNILLLRHPENLFASRIRKARFRPVSSLKYPLGNGVEQQMFVRLWKSHARELLGDTRQLDHLVPVYYDRWIQDQGQRRELSRQLGLNYNDKGLDSIASQGRGSSFDGGGPVSEKYRKDVLNRRDRLDVQERELLDEICSDPEIRTLAGRLENWNMLERHPAIGT